MCKEQTQYQIVIVAHVYIYQCLLKVSLQMNCEYHQLHVQSAHSM